MKTKTSLWLLMAAAAIIPCLTACKVARQQTVIEITPSSSCIETGRTLTATASRVVYLKNDDGSMEQLSSEDVTASCEWSTSSEAVLRHQPDGTFLGSAPGQATVTATCGKVSGDCSITVTGKHTGIEVCNLSTELKSADWGTVNTLSVRPAGQLLKFTGGYSFEYRTTHEGGEHSDWFRVSSADGADGPLTAAELEEQYGLKAEAYMEQLSDFAYADNFRLRADGNPEEGFSIDVPARHYTEPHGCNACYRLSVAGDTAVSRIKILQCSDQYAVEYTDTAVFLTFMIVTEIAHDVWEWQNRMRYYDTVSYTIKNFYRYPSMDTLIHIDAIEPGSFQGSEMTPKSSLVRKQHRVWASGCYSDDWTTEHMWDLKVWCNGGTIWATEPETTFSISTLNCSSLVIHLVFNYLTEEEFLEARK